jgi:hypothetical protein
LAKDQGLSIKRSCKLVNLSRAAYYREADRFAMRDAPVGEAFNAVAVKHGPSGFWCHARLRLDGYAESQAGVAGLLPDEAESAKANQAATYEAGCTL